MKGRKLGWIEGKEDERKESIMTKKEKIDETEERNIKG